MDLFGQNHTNEPASERMKTQKFNFNTDNNETWLTPPEIIRALGEFDLDPCSPKDRPWPTARKHLTIDDEALLHPWEGRVWLNPPYGKYMEPFLHKMALHNNGVALTFARTETKAFQQYIFPHAESMLFISGRLYFHTIDGSRAKFNSGAPSVLIGYNEFNSEMIDQSGIKGAHIPLRPKLFVAAITRDADKTWRVVVGEALEELRREATLSEIYDAVLRMAPGKVRSNPHHKAKIRQILQLHYDKIATATYKLN